VAGPFVYAARGALGLQVIEVSQPDAPRLVGLIATPSLALSVAATDQVVYVTDSSFGLQVIRGPGPTEPDTDGDGSVDFFDAFPTDPTEWQDTDGDRMGDNADPDNDNDGFTDVEEATATPPTDPLNPRQYPLMAPPPGVTTLIVDAASPVAVRARNGTPEAPYRSVTEALQVLRRNQAPQVHTLHLRAGLYAPSTTQEVFPLDFSDLAPFTLQGDDQAPAVLDVEFRDEAVVARNGQDLVFEDLTITHGLLGLAVSHSRDIVIRRNVLRDNNDSGILLLNTTNTVIQGNLTAFNRGPAGIVLYTNSEAVMTQNVSRANASVGIQVHSGSRADVRDNVCERNGSIGLLLAVGATAIVRDNVLDQNVLSGIAVFAGSRATLSHNIVQNNVRFGIYLGLSTAEVHDNTVVRNGGEGIAINGESTATLRENTVAQNGRDGVFISSTSVAIVNGGVITQNAGHGIRVGSAEGFLMIPGPSTATIGLDRSTVLEISQNRGAGVMLEDDGFGSKARIDRRQIVFRGNAGGATVGHVVDVAP